MKAVFPCRICHRLARRICCPTFHQTSVVRLFRQFSQPKQIHCYHWLSLNTSAAKAQSFHPMSSLVVQPVQITPPTNHEPLPASIVLLLILQKTSLRNDRPHVPDFIM